MVVIAVVVCGVHCVVYSWVLDTSSPIPALAPGSAGDRALEEYMRKLREEELQVTILTILLQPLFGG